MNKTLKCINFFTSGFFIIIVSVTAKASDFYLEVPESTAAVLSTKIAHVSDASGGVRDYVFLKEGECVNQHLEAPWYSTSTKATYTQIADESCAPYRRAEERKSQLGGSCTAKQKQISSERDSFDNALIISYAVDMNCLCTEHIWLRTKERPGFLVALFDGGSSTDTIIDRELSEEKCMQLIQEN